MKPGFVRVKLIELDPASFQPYLDGRNHGNDDQDLTAARMDSADSNVLLEPICAVNIKEIVAEPGCHDDRYQQQQQETRSKLFLANLEPLENVKTVAFCFQSNCVLLSRSAAQMSTELERFQDCAKEADLLSAVEHLFRLPSLRRSPHTNNRQE